MSKSSIEFICQSCGGAFARWAGRCPQCGSWNSLVETVLESPALLLQKHAKALKPDKLADLDASRYPRIETGMEDFNLVLGGGIVPGAVVLLSGDPGIGKSTLVLQLAANIGQAKKVLYVSGEESGSQIKLRASRLGLGGANIDFLAENNADSIIAAINAESYNLVIIDSIQTMATQVIASAAGSVAQISLCAQLFEATAKKKNIAMIIIGHVTKEGAIAGPKILEHLVDVVLYLEGDRYGNFKALRGIKNRFGSTDEVGIFEMTEKGLVDVLNPSAAMLAERRGDPGSVVAASIEGTRPILIEVQALVSTSVFGYPKRTAAGFDINRLNLLAAVITKRANLNLSNQDIYVNIVGGLKVAEPAIDLAIILSIASSFKNLAVKPSTIVFGEVGLSGEIRSVNNTSKRLAEAKKIGFSSSIGPQNSKASLEVKTLNDAISAALISPV
ncbi:MAG: DNA repair protein RadA [Candidatus Saccharimonadia bacterium]